MATIRKEISLAADASMVWAALRDFGAVDVKVAPGFVTHSRMDGAARIVTFANGTSARELLVTLDDTSRRVVYAVAPNERIAHHNAVVEIKPDGAARCLLVWTTDILPDAIAPYIDAQMSTAVSVMKRALEGPPSEVTVQA